MPEVKDRARRAGAGDADAVAAQRPRKRLGAASSTTMTVRVPSSLSATFDAISLITEDSVGAHIRAALEEYLVRHWSPDRLAAELAAAREAQDAAKAEKDALAAAGLAEAVERVDTNL